MSGWGVLLIIFAYFVAAVFFGSINMKKQERRCNHFHRGGLWDGPCGHSVSAFLGYPAWPVFLTMTIVYEFAVGQVDTNAQTRTERRQAKKLAKKRAEHTFNMESLAMEQQQADARKQIAITMRAEAEARSQAHMKMQTYEMVHR